MQNYILNSGEFNNDNTHIKSKKMKTNNSKSNRIKKSNALEKYLLIILITTLCFPLSLFAQEVSQDEIDKHIEVKKAAKKQAVKDVTEQDNTGNDPRAFARKWTPNYKNTKLENGMVQQDITVSGTIAFNRNLGVIFEVPVAQFRDFSEVEGLPAGTPQNAIGMGDVSLKFLANLRSLDFFYGEGKKKSGTIVVGTDFVLPVATSPYLAGNSFKIAPIVGVVVDMPAHAFFAFLNLYYFDVYKSDDAPKTSMYVGRWFYMQPLTPPGKWWGLFYLMPEFQPVYNFETKDWSAWIGVEFGKIITEGNVAYVKPGWGIDNSEMTDRNSTLEVGWRLFF
jgi:hypothetical protein